MNSYETHTQQNQGSGAFSGEVQAPTQQTLSQRRPSLESAIRADSDGILRPSTFAEAMRVAGELAKSQFVPKDFIGKPENVLGAIMMGAELGIGPMMSVQNIAVINGRPSVWGDMMLGLCRRHPEWGGIDETGDDKTARCVVTRYERLGGKVVEKRYVGEFTIEEAKHAKLLEKDTPWKYYPKRMLKYRARGFALRDAFGDVLKGLHTVEEMRDVIDVVASDIVASDVTPTENAVAAGAPPSGVPAEPVGASKSGAAAVRERLKAKQEGAAASKTPSTPPPALNTTRIQGFLNAYRDALYTDDLGAIRNDLKPVWDSWTEAEQAAVTEAAEGAKKRLQEG